MNFIHDKASPSPHSNAEGGYKAALDCFPLNFQLKIRT